MRSTIQELVNDPVIIEASKIDDSLLPLLSDVERAAILACRKLTSERLFP